MGKYVSPTLSPLIEMSAMALQFKLRIASLLPPPPPCPSIFPFFVLKILSYFSVRRSTLLSRHLLSPSIAPRPIHSFLLIPHSVGLLPSLFTLCWLTSFSSFISPLPPSLSLSVGWTTASLVLGQINKPSVAHWEPMLAALPRRLILPILSPPSFYSFFCLCLSSFVSISF